MGNSSISKHSKGKVSGPGRRTGEGTNSLVRYLQEDLETKPQELQDKSHPFAVRLRAA